MQLLFGTQDNIRGDLHLFRESLFSDADLSQGSFCNILQ